VKAFVGTGVIHLPSQGQALFVKANRLRKFPAGNKQSRQATNKAKNEQSKRKQINSQIRQYRQWSNHAFEDFGIGTGAGLCFFLWSIIGE